MWVGVQGVPGKQEGTQPSKQAGWPAGRLAGRQAGSSEATLTRLREKHGAVHQLCLGDKHFTALGVADWRGEGRQQQIKGRVSRASLLCEGTAQAKAGSFLLTTPHPLSLPILRCTARHFSFPPLLLLAPYIARPRPAAAHCSNTLTPPRSFLPMTPPTDPSEFRSYIVQPRPAAAPPQPGVPRPSPGPRDHRHQRMPPPSAAAAAAGGDAPRPPRGR